MKVVEGGWKGREVRLSWVDVCVRDTASFELLLDFGVGHSCTTLRMTTIVSNGG